MHMIPASANNFATSPTLLIFSSLSSGLNPRFLFSPVRRLSPSSPYVGIPLKHKYCSKAFASVVFPAPDKPVWWQDQMLKSEHELTYWIKTVLATLILKVLMWPTMSLCSLGYPIMHLERHKKVTKIQVQNHLVHFPLSMTVWLYRLKLNEACYQF